MKIKRKKVDHAIERKIATGAVVSTDYLRELKAIYDEDFILSPYAAKVVSWCIQYHETYQSAPQSELEALYEQYKRKGLDENTAELISDFLADISDEYERSDKFNVQYLLDQTEEYFKTRSFKLLSEDIEACLADNDLQEAELAYDEFRKVQRELGEGIEPLFDEDAIHQAFEEAPKPLFKVPGVLGEMVNPHFVRDSLISFLGPEKRGKSWWLMYFALRAVMCRCNVAFFSVGDMSQDQMLRRMYVALAKKSDRQRYCGTFRRPVMDCVYNQKDECDLNERACDCGIGEAGEAPDDYRPCVACRKDYPEDYCPATWFEEVTIEDPLTAIDCIELAEKFQKRTKGRDFKLYTCPNSTINSEGICNVLDRWEAEGDGPFDVIVIDYADIMDDEKGTEEFRHRQDARWKALRRMSQERHCCVLTATQADADSYDREILGMKNFSEDKRKYAHVTGFFTLNQTKAEKMLGKMRLAQLLAREEEFHSEETITVLQSLRQGQVCLDSYKPKKERTETE